jgi:hypothetical protein
MAKYYVAQRTESAQARNAAEPEPQTTHVILSAVRHLKTELLRQALSSPLSSADSVEVTTPMLRTPHVAAIDSDHVQPFQRTF